MYRIIFHLCLVVALVCCGSGGAVAATAPTLTSVTTLTGATEDQSFIITYATLALAANESLGVTGFRIQSVISGTLAIRSSPIASPSPISPGNTILVVGQELIWTPVANAHGTAIPVFRIRAWDGTENSASDVDVAITVSQVDDPPTLTAIATLKKGANGFGEEDATIVIRHVDVMNNANAGDIDSAPINFKIMSVVSGSLGFRKQGATATTPVAPGTTILRTDEELVWQPPANAHGELTACAVVATANGADSLSSIPLKILVDEVDDPLSIAPSLNAVEYSLNTSGSVFLLPEEDVTISDPESKPTLIKNGKALTITGTIANRQGLEDHLLVRPTEDCKVDVAGNGTWNIFARAKTGVLLATATFNSLSGEFLITVDTQAETYASTTTNPPPPSRSVILVWLLQCVAYGNHAGEYAQAPAVIRQVSLTMLEADAKKSAAPFLANITLAITNEPPAPVGFNLVHAEPGGSGELELSVDDKGVIPTYDKVTSNDELTFELSELPKHGELIDLSSHKPITTFKGARLNNNAVSPIRLSGIGYRNTNAKALTDRFRLRAKDAGKASSESEISVDISTKPGKALIISDPVLVLVRGQSHIHQLTLSGVPGAVGTLSIGQLADFPKPSTSVYPQMAVVTPKATTVTTQTADHANPGSASVSLFITPPTAKTSDYLGFTVTWKLSDNNQVTQPFIIRLDPPLPVILLQSAN